LKGDPTKTGLYTIQLTVPANTKIEAHTHPDDRVATVISRTWQIGYGTAFDEKKLKALLPGSFYTEPPNVAHFARTGNTAVMVQITGYGPAQHMSARPGNEETDRYSRFEFRSTGVGQTTTSSCRA
jgi:uncharacterized RmlC-like cupin family protein